MRICNAIYPGYSFRRVSMLQACCRPANDFATGLTERKNVVISVFYATGCLERDEG